jgi:ferredoxin
MVAAGLGNEGHPDPREVAAFERFARGLDRTLALIGAGSAPARARLGTGVLNALLSPVPRGVARRFTRWTMGRKRVDPALCRRCGLCATVCPYGAVSLGPGAGALPAFDEGRCESCWSCYNHCPAKAIHTARHRGVGHYPRPNEHVRRALGASAGD